MNRLNKELKDQTEETFDTNDEPESSLVYCSNISTNCVSPQIHTNILPQNEFDENMLEEKLVASQKQNEKNKVGKIGAQSAELEKRLEKMVDQSGGLTNIDQVPKLLQLMHKEQHIENQSLLLTILIATKDNLSLTKFTEGEGLNILNSWVVQAKLEGKLAQLRLLLKVLQQLPVTLKALRTSSIGKSVNKLKNFGDAEVALRASKLVESWTKLLNSTMEVKEEKNAKHENQKKITQRSVVYSDDFDTQLSNKPLKLNQSKTGAHKLAPELMKVKKHTMQLIDGAEAKITPKSPFVGKPLSNDAIKKAKFKEKMLGISETKGTHDQIQENIHTDEYISEPPNKRLKLNQTVSEENLQATESTDRPTSTSVGTGKPKKRVTWPSDDKLEAVKVFMKEEEPSYHPNFYLARQNELKNERLALTEKKKHEEEELKLKQDALEPKLEYRCPPVLYIEKPLVRGRNSKQAPIQAQREQIELAAFYMHTSQIPDTPAEPTETVKDYDDSVIPLIPFEEIQSTFQASSSMETPNTSDIKPDFLSLLQRPEVLAHLVSIDHSNKPISQQLQLSNTSNLPSTNVLGHLYPFSNIPVNFGAPNVIPLNILQETQGHTQPKEEKKICQFWNSSKGCRNGSNCPWIHEKYSGNVNPLLYSSHAHQVTQSFHQPQVQVQASYLTQTNPPLLQGFVSQTQTQPQVPPFQMLPPDVLSALANLHHKR